MATLFKNNKGTALVEAALVLPILTFIIIVLIDLYSLESHLFKGHIVARNNAWTSSSQGFGSLWGKIKQGDFNGLDMGSLTKLLNVMAGTSHGHYAAHDTLTMLGIHSVSINYYVDNNPWKLSKVSLKDIGTKFKKMFFKDPGK